MGCGKSTIGKELALKFNLTFLDTDIYIEENEGCPITEIFAQKGEQYFRELETGLLQDMINENYQGKAKIISVGGGLPIREENRKLLKEIGQVIYLKARPETLYERLKGDTTRPLLQTANPQERIREMLVEREAKYQAAAEKVIEVDGKQIEEIVEEISGML